MSNVPSIHRTYVHMHPHLTICIQSVPNQVRMQEHGGQGGEWICLQAGRWPSRGLLHTNQLPWPLHNLSHHATYQYTMSRIVSELGGQNTAKFYRAWKKTANNENCCHLTWCLQKCNLKCVLWSEKSMFQFLYRKYESQVLHAKDKKDHQDC